MFEDSTFESTGKIRTRSRRWMFVTFALNASVLLALILIPLINPEALPRISSIMLIEAPAPPPDAPRPVHVPPGAVAVQRSFDLSTFTAPSHIPPHIDYTNIHEIPDSSGVWTEMSGDPKIPSGDNPFGVDRRPAVVVSQPKGPTNVSKGVMEGLLLRKVVPSYPPFAKASRTEGTVVLQATISKSGQIENLRVVTGSPMLTQAAMSAVSQWLYRPYLLNGQPVEVETTVNVDFRLN